MSYEKNVKDLLDRLVSMAPEPPPYPEEAPIARPAAKRKFSPVLVFASALAVVAVLAIPLLLWTGSGPEVAGSTTLVPVTTVTSADTETTATEIDPVGVTWTGIVYLTQTPEESFLGNPALVPLAMEVTGASLGDDVDFSRALTALSEQGESLPQGFGSSIPEGVIVEDLTEETDGATRTVVAEMSEEFLAGAGGLLADVTMLNQIIYTLTEGEPDSMVRFTVGGEPVEAFGSEGLGLADPVDRRTFIDSLNVIFLTEPILEVEEVYIVSGLANTFEGALMVGVIDASGELVHEEPVQATCGSGCWGEFGVGVDRDLIVRGESAIQLYTYSPEDGSPRDILTLPIPVDPIERWNLG